MTSKEWKKVKIENICLKVCSGGTPKSTVAEYYNGDIPWLNTKEINFNRIYNTEKKITNTGFKNSSAKWIDINSIIVAMYGATAGKVAITKIPITTNQACCNLTIDDKKADYSFVYYALVQNYKVLLSMANGGAQQNLNAQQIKDFEIGLPPLETQEKIARILSSLDDKIELNNEINQNLEQQAQAIFDKFFGSCQIGNKIIGDYLSPKRGKNLLSKDTKDGNIPVIAGGLKPATYHNIANTTAPVITISASGANAGFVNLWQVPVWASDSSYIDSTINPYIYFWYILLKKRQKEIFDSQTGSAQPHIYPKHIEQMAIFDLNIINVKNYNDMVQPLFETIGNNLSENKQLTQLRDTLLLKLMSGEIDVDKVEV